MALSTQIFDTDVIEVLSWLALANEYGNSPLLFDKLTEVEQRVVALVGQLNQNERQNQGISFNQWKQKWVEWDLVTLSIPVNALGYPYIQ